MNVAQAKQIRIDELLHRLGLYPARETANGYMFHSILSFEGDSIPSFQVSPDGHAFHDWSTGYSGSIVDLAMLILRTRNVSDALAYIEDTMGHGIPTSSHQSLSFYTPRKIEILSTKTVNSPSLIRYATNRGVSRAIIQQYCREIHYRVGNKVYYSLGMPNDRGGWELRNPYSKIASSPKDITTIGNLCNCPYLVFEGFFDFMSAVMLSWFNSNTMNAIILNSTALVERSIPVLVQASQVICCLDNDAAGCRAAEYIIDAIPEAQDYSHRYSAHNDLNDYLLQRINKKI